MYLLSTTGKVGGARRTRNRSRSEQVGGMAGAEEPTAEETAPVTGEDGEVVATGEESTVSNTNNHCYLQCHYSGISHKL